MNKEAIEIIEKIKDQASRATMVQDRSVGIIKQTCGVISKECDQTLAILKEQPPAGDFTKRFRILLAAQDKTAVVQDGYEACTRLDRSEASRKELLTACKMGLNAMRGIKDINQLNDGPVKNERRLEANIKQIEAAIKQGD